MNEMIRQYNEKLIAYWQQLNKNQKMKLIFAVLFIVGSLTLVTILATKTKYELTYVDLDQKTAGKVVTKLEEMGVPYQLTAGGSNISVPEAQASKVKVALAQEDLGSGNIYSKFWEKASFGMTESQFKLLERGAIEEELKGLIVGIQGIKNAYVMITLPDEKVFYNQDQQFATASVVVDIAPGVELTPVQIKSVYNLISKSVPNLPIENITLSDQYGDPLELTKFSNNHTDIQTYNQQLQIQKEYQQEIKKELESMLRRIMGPDRATVTVFAKMNFDQERTLENLKEPVIDGEGIARSLETIQETFSGNGASGGAVGTGDTQIPGYQGTNSDAGEFERLEKRVNYDVNEITKEVIKSPYRLEDLSIIVAVDLPNDSEQSLKTQEAIQLLIQPIVSAALGKNDEETKQNIAVVAHQFQDNASLFNNSSREIDPMYLYGALGLTVLALGGLGYNVTKRRKKENPKGLNLETTKTEFDFTPVLSDEAILQQEIQKLSKQKPTEFVKLIRTWLSED